MQRSDDTQETLRSPYEYDTNEPAFPPSPMSSNIQLPEYPVPHDTNADIYRGQALHEFDGQNNSEPYQRLGHNETDELVAESTGSAVQKPIPPTSQNKPLSTLGLVSSWWLEVLACLLALGALFAIVGTVYPYQNLPIPKWPYSLSVNTVVAVYVTILKVALAAVVSSGLGQLKWAWFQEERPLRDMETFDGASRGVLGSFRLLWTIRNKNIIASIGALVMILMTIVDPFGQQLVHFYSCESLDSSSNATIGTVNFVSAGEASNQGAGLATINLPMQKAIWNSVFADQNPQPSFECPSGNCTFVNPYKTAAHCSKCQDVSDELDIVDAPGVLNFTLPSGLTARQGSTEFVMRGMSTRSELTVEAIFAFGANFDVSDTAAAQSCNGSDIWHCRGYGAARCKVHPCVQSMTNATVNIGNLSETVASEAAGVWGGAALGVFALSSTVDVSCLNNAEKDSLLQLGYAFNDSTPWLAYNLSGYAGDSYNASLSNDDPEISSAAATNIRPECIYQFAAYDYSSLSSYLADYFTGDMPFQVESEPSKYIALQQIYQEGAVNYSIISNTFERLASAMTVYSRGPGSYEAASTFSGNKTSLGTQVFGEVYRTDTCVGARWPWLAFPAALALFTLVFFTAMVVGTVRTNRDGPLTQNYKTAALPLLYYGLERTTQEKLGQGVQSVSSLNQKAKHLLVRLESEDQSWKLAGPAPKLS